MHYLYLCHYTPTPFLPSLIVCVSSTSMNGLILLILTVFPDSGHTAQHSFPFLSLAVSYSPFIT